MGRVGRVIAVQFLPGTTMRIGGASAIIVRICTGEVCVRISRRDQRDGFACCPATTSVYCVSRAGWLGGKLSASKL